jgi:hypothetical protein
MSEEDPNLYFILVGVDQLILVLYVDDFILTCVEELIAGCKAYFVTKFEMKDIGLMHYFLGLWVRRVSREIFLGQWKYAVEISRRFRMEDYRLMATPMVTNLKNFVTYDSYLVDPRIYRDLIGSLMYLVNTSSYIYFSINTLIQFMVDSR